MSFLTEASQGTIIVRARDRETVKEYLELELTLSGIFFPDRSLDVWRKEGNLVLFTTFFKKDGRLSRVLMNYQENHLPSFSAHHKYEKRDLNRIIDDIHSVIYDYMDYSRYENILERHKTIVNFTSGVRVEDEAVDILCSAQNRIKSGFEESCVLDRSLESLKRLDLSVIPKEVADKLAKFKDSDWLLLSNVLGFQEKESEDFFEDTEDFWGWHGDEIADFCSVFNVSKEEGDGITRFMNTVLLLADKNCKDFYPLRQRYFGLYPYEAACHLMKKMSGMSLDRDVWLDILYEYRHSKYFEKIRNTISLIYQEEGDLC